MVAGHVKRRRIYMRFISIFTHEPSDRPPTEAEMASMGKLIEEGMKAGWLIATEGVHFGATGVRVHKSAGGKVTVSHAVMPELFDRKLALPQFARKRIRWCEVIVSLKERRAVAVQRVLARYIHFDAHGLLDLDRQLEEARLRMDVSSAEITAEDLSPDERLVREAKTWLDRQVIAQECEGEPDQAVGLLIDNVALDPRPRLWLRPAMRKE